MPSLAESVDQHVQIGIYDTDLSIINDLIREERLYINSNQSKVISTETERSLLRPYIAHEAIGVFILNVKFIFLLKFLILYAFF